MGFSEDSKPYNPKEALCQVEKFWQAKLPAAFTNLYTHYAHPFLAPCEFFSLADIAAGEGRSFGMIPQYLPFGRAIGEGGLYGFYITPDTQLGAWPVLYWDDDEMYLRPAASDFEAFIGNCVLIGRYEMETQLTDSTRDWEETSDQALLAHLLGIPEQIVLGPVPRNDTELYEKQAGYDPQDAFSLCHLGCTWRGRGDSERALDFFHRAIESAPWFGDSSYLLADIHREKKNYKRAAQGWWAVVQQLLPLCTRSWEWNLGDEHPEADIYELAADALSQFGDAADESFKSSPLWKVVVHEDPYDPAVRESLGNTLSAEGRELEAEREYLNALSLSCTERGKQPDRLYDALESLYKRSDRLRDASMVRFDRSLPRTTI